MTRRKKGIVKHTKKRSAVSIWLSAAWKTVKRLAVDALIVIGLTTVIVLVVRYFSGG